MFSVMPTARIRSLIPGSEIFRWGHIQRLSAKHAALYEIGPNGPYEADPEGGPMTWRLRCDCGHEWDLLAMDFPGKKRLRSCGRPECPFTPGVRLKRHKAIEEKRVSINVSVPAHVAANLRQYADSRNLNFSQAVTKCALTGLLHLMVEE
jgi:hypothetical protein